MKATKKSTPAARAGTVNHSALAATKPAKPRKAAGIVKVPVLADPYMKAPATDPYLRAGTVTSESVKICGYQLPPILRGIQPGKGLNSQPVDYPVKVIWISRRQIEGMMASVEGEYPELGQMLAIMKAFMCRLDTVRDESKFGILAALGWIKKEQPDNTHAIDNLNAVVRMLGRWDDENRLGLY